LALGAALGAGCTKSSDKPQLWVYTSLYNHVVQDFKDRLAAKLPGVQINWYQAGSENVAAKLNAEFLAGKPQADLVLTSDLFWYEDLKARGALLAYDSPGAAKVAAQFKDPEHFWATSRVPVMVVAYNTDAFTDAEAPKSFADLTAPRFKDKVAMPSPLESGTAFTAVALLSRKLGWDYFAKLRANGALAAGGNSAVMARLESKERPVGVILLENVISTRRKNPKIKAVYPIEGVVSIPSPIAILKTTKHPELAKQVYDYFFTTEGQQSIVKGDMHSIFTEVAPPEGAKPWSEIMGIALPWNMKVIAEVRAERDAIKQRFSRVMLE
jgi:iron(III) transport system substrate-binding protein